MDSHDLSAACFYLPRAPRAQAETAEVLNYQDWCLTGVMSKCWQTISLTWGRQGNMTRVHTGTFLSSWACCSCKILLLSVPFERRCKGTWALLPKQCSENRHPLHFPVCAGKQHFCHLTKKSYLRENTVFSCPFCLRWDILGSVLSWSQPAARQCDTETPRPFHHLPITCV